MAGWGVAVKVTTSSNGHATLATWDEDGADDRGDQGPAFSWGPRSCTLRMKWTRHPCHTSLEGAADRGDKPTMCVRDRPFHPAQSACFQRTEERGPKQSTVSPTSNVDVLGVARQRPPARRPRETTRSGPRVLCSRLHDEHVGIGLLAQWPLPELGDVPCPGDLGTSRCPCRRPGIDEVIDFTGGDPVHVSSIHDWKMMVNAASPLHQRREERSLSQFRARKSS